MEIKHYESSRNGSFELKDNGEAVAEITYRKSSDSCIMVDHTGVNIAYRGQKLGEKLVAEVVDFARRENLKVTPICSYAKAIMERKADYCDVLLKDKN